MITGTSLFAGAGGDTFGASMVPGVVVTMAANHWPLAVAVHQENHPHADHDVADISQVDPRRYPNTDILWASPSCTKHSIAQGRKYDPEDIAAERSRATMWDPLRFTEFHRYRFVFCENVVDVLKWPLIEAWRVGWSNLGYCLHEVYLNAAFAGKLGPTAAQWRDRWFAMAHPTGTPCPDIERWTCPEAWCPSCETVRWTYQAWKRPDVQAGKYRAQYVYRCRTCKTECQPAVRQAAEIIDWDLPAQRIGDRAKPLADKTMRRILIGLQRYGVSLVPVEGRDGKMPFGVDRPMRTCTGRNETGLLVPAGGTWNDTAYPMSAPFRTRTTREQEGILVPPFIAELRGGHSTTRQVSEPLATVTAGGFHHGLTIPQAAAHASFEELLASLHRRKSRALQHLVNGCGFRMLTAEEYAAAMEFPADYLWQGSKRDRVRMAGQAVPTNMARDLIACGVESMQLPVEVAA